eukprot:CFRG8504T1
MSAQAMMAEQEMEAMTLLFNGMVDTCYKKCIPGAYREGDLTKGEAVCLDRCAAKYIDLSEKIGRQMTEIQNTMAAAQVPQ